MGSTLILVKLLVFIDNDSFTRKGNLFIFLLIERKFAIIRYIRIIHNITSKYMYKMYLTP